MWDDILKKMKSDGLNMVETYIFWNLNMPEENVFIWEGSSDYSKFMDLCKKHNLFVTIRLGPYVCAEWSYGGLPAWLNNKEGIILRSHNEIYENAMENYLKQVINRLRNYFSDKGGPIILAQIENEFQDNDDEYVKWCGDLAKSFEVNVPFMMCSGSHAEGTIASCNGNDCATFLESHGDDGKVLVEQPGIWSENEGNFQMWGEKSECYDSNNCEYPSREATELAYATLRWFARGGDMMNYYLYMGGNNYGNSASDMVTTMYANYVNYHSDTLPNEPKHTHINNLDAVLINNAEAIVYDEVKLGKETHLKIFDGNDFVESNLLLSFKYEGNGKTVSFLENTDVNSYRVKYDNTEYYMCEKSILIVDKNYKVLYNTSNLPNIKSNHEIKNLKNDLTWKYWVETIDNLGNEGKAIIQEELLEQVGVTLDKTEYMYYEANVTISSDTCKIVIGGYGQNAFLIYVDNKFAGETYYMSHGSIVERNYEIEIKGYTGEHKLTILSEHFGIVNFFHESEPVGKHGVKSVTICGEKYNGIWLQRPYLSGEIKEIYTSDGSSKVEWSNDLTSLPKTAWFQTTFKNPDLSSNKHLYLDANGLGRGHAYINGHDLGRYWTINGKGQNSPTQRYYYIPKSWLKSSNILTLGEIIGVTDISSVGLSYSEGEDDDFNSGDTHFVFIILGVIAVIFVLGLLSHYIYVTKIKKDKIVVEDPEQFHGKYEKI